MSFFKWLSDHARASNNRHFARTDQAERTRQNREAAEQAYKNSLNACANCGYFNAYGRCVKHDFSYSIDDMKYKQIHYTRTCRDFFRR